MNNLKSKAKFTLPAFLTFIFCCLLFTAYFAVYRLYPLGSKSIVWCDLEQQHIPLLLEFKNIIHSGGSLLLGKGGGGMNIFGVFLFFISSPFSLLALLVDVRKIVYFINVITVLKLAASGFSASVFFRYIFKSLPASNNIILSLMYAFCGYGLMYYQNNMWLDMMYLFPILLLSLYRLVYSEKCDLYVICLSFSMILNFYLTFMNVIFIIVGFGIIIYTCRKNKRSKSCLLFLLGSVFAALITSFIWIPSLIQYTSSGRSESASRLFAAAYFIDYIPDKLALLLCTSAIISGFFIIFLRHSLFSINLNKSIAAMFLAMLIAVFIEPINRVFHTGSYQAYPLRYGYIVVFLGLCVCAAALSAPRRNAQIYNRKKAVFISLIICIAAVLMTVFISIFRADKINSYVTTLWVSNKDILRVLLISAPFIIGYFFLIIFRSNGCLNTKFVTLFLAVLFVGESFLSTHYYMKNTTNDLARFKETVNITNKIDDNSFYRVKENEPHLCSNMFEGLGFSSIAHYTSLNDRDFFYNMKRLGYSSYWLDSATSGGTMLTDAFLLNKYVISNGNSYNTFHSFRENTNVFRLYQNNVIFYGALMSDTAPQSLSDYNKFSRMDTTDYIAEKLLGVPDTVYECTPYECENVSLINKDGKYQISIDNPEKAACIKYSFLAKNKTEVYFDIFGNYSTNLNEEYNSAVNVYVGGRKVQSDYPKQHCSGILDLGTFEEQYVNVKVLINKDFTADCFGLYTLDVNKISNAVVNADSAPIKLSKNKITLSPESDGWIYIPFTYNKGFSAKINGKKCEIHKALGSFMAVKAKNGDKVELTFCPVGLKFGIAVSIIGTILFILFIIFEKKTERKIKRKTYQLAEKIVSFSWLAAVISIYILSVLLWLILQFIF